MPDAEPRLRRILRADFGDGPHVRRLPELAQHVHEVAALQAFGDIPIGPEHDAVSLQSPATDHIAVIRRKCGVYPHVAGPTECAQRPTPERLATFADQQARMPGELGDRLRFAMQT